MSFFDEINGRCLLWYKPQPSFYKRNKSESEMTQTPSAPDRTGELTTLPDLLKAKSQ